MQRKLILTPEFINDYLDKVHLCAEKTGLLYESSFLEPGVNVDYQRELAKKIVGSNWIVVNGDKNSVVVGGRNSGAIVSAFQTDLMHAGDDAGVNLTSPDCDAMIAFAYLNIRDEKTASEDQKKFKTGIVNSPSLMMDAMMKAGGLPVIQSNIKIAKNNNGFELTLCREASGIKFENKFKVLKELGQYQIFPDKNIVFELSEDNFNIYKNNAIRLLNSKKDFSAEEVTFLTTCLVDEGFSVLFAEKAVFFNDEAWRFTQKIIKSAYQNENDDYVRIKADMARAEDRKVFVRKLAVAVGVTIGVIGVACLTLLAVAFYPVIAIALGAVGLNLLIGGASLGGALAFPFLVSGCFKIKNWCQRRPFNALTSPVVGSTRGLNTALEGGGAGDVADTVTSARSAELRVSASASSHLRFSGKPTRPADDDNDYDDKPLKNKKND